jgi:toxin ParE1/3/4
LPQYRLRPAAGRDLNQHADYLLAEAGPETALNFVDCARSSFDRLAGSSGMGSPVRSANPALAGLRKWRIDGFPKVLIFYATRDRGIDILRLLHASSDWEALFDAD